MATIETALEMSAREKSLMENLAMASQEEKNTFGFACLSLTKSKRKTPSLGGAIPPTIIRDDR